MRILLAVAVLALFYPFSSVRAQSPGTTSAPASTATAPAPDAAARDALRNFFRAILAADEKTAFEMVAYSKPEDRKTYEAMFGEAMAGERLSAAAAAEFGQDAATQLDLSQDDLATIEKNMDKAKVSLKADTAEIIVDPKMPAFVMVLKRDKWMVDFEKTQQNMGPPPEAEDTDASLKKAAGFNQLAADIKAKKVKNFQEVRDRVRALQAAADAETSDLPQVPATHP